VTAALQRFRGPDYVYPEHGYKPWSELARLLAGVVPGRRARSFRATGGSEAIEFALQAAMLHTKRRRFLSLEDAYHGNTIGALSVAGSENRETYPNLLASCDKIAPPLDTRALEKIETRLKRRDVAAFVMEPVSINLGVLVPSTSFMTELQRLCRRYKTLLVMDQVACGFGRTGTLFASEQFDVEPDILCVGKAITAGTAGLGAMIATPQVASSMEEDGSFWSTYSISTVPLRGSNRSTLLNRRMSSIVASARNCWPPIACRPPARHTASPSDRARRSSSCRIFSESISTMRRTRVALSCEWMSLTRRPGACGCWTAAFDQAGPSASSAAVLRNVRR
jgi:hypothetical protein